MPSTFIRVNAININGEELLSFTVDGNPAGLELLTVAPDRPPLDAFMKMVSDPATDTDVVTNAGRALLADLMRHVNWQNSLATTLNTAGRERRINVEIPSIARSAHNFPWEVLYSGQGFLATNPGIPFLRIVPPMPDARRDKAVFEGTLRIMAVIAAALVDGTQEWNALRDALVSWTGPVECRVLVDSPVLKAAIDGEGLAHVTCDLVPASGSQFLRMVGDFMPLVFHVFCHGRADHSARLEIAHNGVRFGGPPLFVSAAELAPHLGTAWLVTINACSSGQVDVQANTNSIASELVERGIPFVTSMRQEVSAQAAHCFTGAFYMHWLAQLDDDVRAGGSFDLNIDAAAVVARNAITQKYGGGPAVEARIKEWSLPIVCAGSTRFEIRQPAPQSALSEQSLVQIVAEIQQLKGALAAGGWSDEEHDVIEQRIAALQQRMGRPG